MGASVRHAGGDYCTDAQQHDPQKSAHVQPSVKGVRQGLLVLTKLSGYAADRLVEKVMDQVDRAETAVVPLATCVDRVVAVMMIGLYGPMTGLYQVLLR